MIHLIIVDFYCLIKIIYHSHAGFWEIKECFEVLKILFTYLE